MAFAKARARVVNAEGRTLVNLSFPEAWDGYVVTAEMITKVLNAGSVELNGQGDDLLSEFGERKEASSSEGEDIPF